MQRHGDRRQQSNILSNKNQTKSIFFVGFTYLPGRVVVVGATSLVLVTVVAVVAAFVVTVVIIIFIVVHTHAVPNTTLFLAVR